MSGWKVVCPDGKERHYPYINRGDADFDARQFRTQCDCPGKHEVEACVYTMPAPTAQA